MYSTMRPVSLLLTLFLFGITCTHADSLFDNQIRKWEKKAKKGDKRALYKLGRAYWHGRQVKQDVPKALKYLKASADKGYSKAAYRLGVIYNSKNPQYRNHYKAYKWFARAAKNDHGISQFHLAKLLFSGKGVKKNLDSARLWAARAKKNRVRSADALLVQINRARQKQIAANTRVQPKSGVPKTRDVPPPGNPAGRSKPLDPKQVLSSHYWVVDGKPAVKMPSRQSECEVKTGRIRCITKNLTQKRDDYRATYELISVLSNFGKDGSFDIRYKLKYLSVNALDKDEVDSEVEIPKVGLQKTTSTMRCRVIHAKSIKCFSDDFQVIRYKSDKKKK